MSRNKLRVSTRAVGKEMKVRKIIDAAKNIPEGFTPKQIALPSGINVNTVKSLLPKIECIRNKGIRGLYELVDEDGHDRIFDWNFHNCILSYSLPNFKGESVNKTLNFCLFNLELTIGAESKKATLRISTEHPFNISSLELCCVVFSQLIREYTALEIEKKEIIVSSIEFNIDYYNLRLDGVKCATLGSLLEQFKIYQKETALRVEHKITVPVGVETILSMLNALPSSPEVRQELLEMKKIQSNQNNSLLNIIGLLQALLNKINKEETRFNSIKM